MGKCLYKLHKPLLQQGFFAVLHHAAHQQIYCALCENSAITDILSTSQCAYSAINALLNLPLWVFYGQSEVT